MPIPLTLDLDEKVLHLSRTSECFHKIYADPQLELQLPRKGAKSGHIVRHAIAVVQKTLDKWGPMVFKCGFTHCPSTRWRNRKFGYAVDRYQKWEQMIILYVSHESVGPSFLESCLIQTFESSSILLQFFFQQGLGFRWSTHYNPKSCNLYFVPPTIFRPFCSLSAKVRVAAAIRLMEERPWRMLRGGHISHT